jgi:hypothetical protein
MGSLNANEQRVYNALKGRANSMELVPGGDVSTSSGVGASIAQVVGNPVFKAEITLQTFVRYFTDAVANTPGTPAAAGAPPAAQQNALPLYLFGNIDFFANYSKARQLVPGGAGWDYSRMCIKPVGNDVLDCYVNPTGVVHPLPYPSGTVWFGNSLPGDLLFVIPMALFVAGAVATSWRAEIIIRCPNVPYMSLLSALTSDTFVINMIRYVVPAANVAQLAQQITLIKTSLFGKTSTDTLDPQTFITPGTFQPQIADMAITIPVDKNITIATQLIYTAVIPIAQTFTLTVQSINKLVA